MFRPLHFPHRLTDRFHHRLPHRFTWGHALGVMVVALVALLACGSVWAQVQGGSTSSGLPGGSRNPAFRPVAPATPFAATGPAAPVSPVLLQPTLTNPINRNPARRAAIAASTAATGSATLASPSAEGFASPPASRDTLVAPDPARDGKPGAL